MSSKNMGAHFEEIEDLVIAQDVPVSYKRISKDLDIHINEAKKILSAFADEKNGIVSETHLVSGKVPSNGGSSFGWHFCVVHKEDVQVLEKSSFFEKTSSHIYSIVQGKKSEEILPDVCTRMEDVGEKFSGILNNNVAVKESNKRRKFMTKQSEPPAFSKKKIEDSNKAKSMGKSISAESKAEPKEEENKNEKKETETPPEKDTKPKQSNVSNNVKNKKGGIANFFQRGAAVAAPKSVEKPVLKKEEEKTKQTDSEPKPETKSDTRVKSNNSICKEKPTIKKVNNTKPKQSSKRKPAKSNDHTNKKRKRIMIASDSESSDEEERMEVDDIEVDEPAPPTAVAEKEEQKTSQDEGICRERKLVDKVFKDEKGFIVTKKVWVTTEVKTNDDKKENEDVQIVKEEIKKEEEKPAAPAKKKQAGIMSFFTRK